VNGATSFKIELKYVLNTNVSIFSTVRLRNWTVHVKCFIPFVIFDNITVLCKAPRLSAWISNSESHSTSVILRHESKSHFFSWRSGKGNIVYSLVTVDDRWESRKSLLSSIESIPDMIHHTVKSVSHGCSVDTNIDRLH
jgi:hypothetical protein